MASKYDNYTREQLVQRILDLESHNIPSTDCQHTTVAPLIKNKKQKQRREKRPFDMSKYTQRKIALRIAYLGWNYSGYASQNKPDEVPTVEDKLFLALQTGHLIENIEDSDYSRCGRTDKGVSGLGQVIALKVRSKKLREQYEKDATLPPPAEEIPYIDMLNRMLPPDIRVLAWTPVDDSFNARFDCTGRTYKYFFCNRHLNIANMQIACGYFEGQHDFRNFCKVDPSKNITNYERHIRSMKIKPAEKLNQHMSDDSSCSDLTSPSSATSFYELELKGSAFLWHQVRYMMSVLFMVGQGLEKPEIVLELLDIDKIPSKPDFPMASDLPLVLYDCEFKALQWYYSTQQGENKYEPIPSAYRTYLHYHEEWQKQMICTLTTQYYLNEVGSFLVTMPDEKKKDTVDAFDKVQSELQQQQLSQRKGLGAVNLVIGGGKESKIAKYKPILLRPRCDSDELKKEKFQARKKRKLDQQPEQSKDIAMKEQVE
ncbi:pseudouridine synthase [Mycotypha africana]|uniref:pseudouridine synthase n=1 Tax=Mycotypha africana TaxID=64632 RepID=UPI0023018DD3|nr:pseudouridine synthase [Mycotypha africana]KAI8977013.1 pseudouridine synthase [Mycotypha africana]